MFVRHGFLAAVLAAALLYAPGWSFAQPSGQPIDATQPPVVVTAGEGVVQVVPDRAWITVAAESRASNPADAQRRNAEVMRGVQDRLRRANLPAEAIRTASYDLQEEWDFVNGRRVSRGFVARNLIEIRVDQLERVGELLQAAVGSGATSVSGLRFDLKDRAAAEREALRRAVADARGRADAAAAGVNRTIDRVLRIEEQGVVVPPPMPFPMAREMAAQMAQADQPPIAAGEMEVRARVTLTSVLR